MSTKNLKFRTPHIIEKANGWEWGSLFKKENDLSRKRPFIPVQRDELYEIAATEIAERGDLEPIKQSAKALFAGFPDLRITIDDLIAEGDKVVEHWTLRSTHKGEFIRIPATGNKTEVTGTTTYRIAGGKIAESWWNADSLGMMQQLGVIPPMGEGGK